MIEAIVFGFLFGAITTLLSGGLNKHVDEDAEFR